MLDPYPDGTQPFVFEFETDPDNLSDGGRSGARGESADFEAEVNIGSDPGTDLFPEGFEDPESGTPLNAACIEIGIDDTLEADCPVDVTSAVVEFFNSGRHADGRSDRHHGGVLRGTSWDGNAIISVPNQAGHGNQLPRRSN